MITLILFDIQKQMYLFKVADIPENLYIDTYRELCYDIIAVVL